MRGTCNSCDSDYKHRSLFRVPKEKDSHTAFKAVSAVPAGRQKRSLTIAGFINAPSRDPSMAFFLRAAAFFTWLKRRRVTLQPGNSSS